MKITTDHDSKSQPKDMPLWYGDDGADTRKKESVCCPHDGFFSVSTYATFIDYYFFMLEPICVFFLQTLFNNIQKIIILKADMWLMHWKGYVPHFSYEEVSFWEN